MPNIRYDFPASAEAGMSPVYCAISLYDPSWQSIPHSHAHAELFYCLAGRGVLQIAGERVPIQDDDFFLINPGVEHTEYSDADHMLQYIVVGVRGVRFSGPDSSDPRFYLLNDRSNRHELLPYFQDLVRELSKDRKGCLKICLGILEIIFTKIERRALVEPGMSAPATGLGECMEAKRLIDERFMEPLTLDAVAQGAHVSKYYLTRTFHRLCGVTPMRYLLERRVREAKHLLRTTDHTLASICSISGFSSPSYLIQAFRRVEGMTPTEYRRLSRAIQGMPPNAPLPAADGVP